MTDQAIERTRLAQRRGYKVLSCGTVISPQGSVVSTSKAGSGRLSFSVRDGGKKHTVYVHLLQAITVYGEEIVECRVVHSDGDVTNCSAVNIRLVKTTSLRNRVQRLRGLGKTFSEISREIKKDRSLCWRLAHGL